jgi:hypothetical protein
VGNNGALRGKVTTESTAWCAGENCCRYNQQSAPAVAAWVRDGWRRIGKLWYCGACAKALVKRVIPATKLELK